MDSNDKVDPAYLKGYNEGYLFAKYLPELSKELSKTQGNTPRSIGFKDGREEFVSEQLKDKFPSWLKGKKNYEQTKQSKHKDRDIEPEL